MPIQTLLPHLKKLGDFQVRRLLPQIELRMVGPWIFFDHMGPAQFAAGSGVNVRPHPHINLATVTYLFEGEILHRDSLGSEQVIQPGDLNLMVAGSGIVHSERERDAVREQPHALEGLQLWHALPEADEETGPAFYHYPAASIPRCEVNGVPVRVLIGQAYGVTSPVKTFAQTLYLEARLQKGQSLTLPDIPEAALYVVRGAVTLDGQAVAAHHMVVFSSSTRVTAQQDTLLAVIGGEPVGERFIDWNFVSSRKERITQAKQDWQQGRFAKVPGDETEFIPLPSTAA